MTTSLAPVDRCRRLEDAGAEVLVMRSDSIGHPELTDVAEELGRRRMTNVLVEGGSQITGAFFDARLIDELHVFIAPKLVGGDLAPSPVSGHGYDRIPSQPTLDDAVIEILDGNIYVHGRLNKTLAFRGQD
jgi:diaminohydroxyphosphoribosylaminopyrimidine deaminase/5-amino-6-(5-phosphoribosylamino)uracil reductase